jgi:peptidoglycan/xylan/chitin deacetylase (PgdA/CDA1 family)
VVVSRFRRRLAASPGAWELGRRLPAPLRKLLRRLAGDGVPTRAPGARSHGGARLILMYHRVATAASDPLELCVAPDRFREHLEVLRAVGEIVPLARLSAERRGRGLSVALTFDDGYADNALVAAPLLEAHDSAATVFVVAGAVGSGGPFWWDRLASLVFQNGDDALHAREYWSAWERLRHLPAPRIEEELASLERERGPVADDLGRPVSVDELVSLGSGPVEIGAHTMTHPSLPVLGSEERRSEIAGSRTRLEELVGRPLEAFAYPYGDYDGGTVRLVRRSGFRRACTIAESRLSRFSSPFLLPRYPVRDWPAEELERRLAQWR